MARMTGHLCGPACRGRLHEKRTAGAQNNRFALNNVTSVVSSPRSTFATLQTTFS